MKRIFSWVLVLLLSVSCFSIEAKAMNVTDINGHWAQPVLQDWLNKGYINGYADGTLKPDNLISRAEFFALINKSFGFANTTNINFSDVSSNAWYYNTVRTAVATGYVSGYSNNTIQPERYITREEASAMLTSVGYITPYESGANVYTDVNQGRWSRPYIGAVSNAGIMQGYPDGSFKPEGNMTRAEAVKSINGALLNRSKSTGAYVQPIENQTNNSPGLVQITPNYGNLNPYIPNTSSSGNTSSTSSSSSSKGNSSGPGWVNINSFEFIVDSSSYGSSKDGKVINGNTRIDVNTSLRNVDINGDVVISSKVKGNVNFNEVSVSGTIYIEGAPRLSLTDSSVNDIHVNSSSSTTKITTKDDSSVGTVYAYSAVTLEESKSKTYSGFEDVVIEDNVKNGAKIELMGDFGQVDVYSGKVKIYLTSGKIDTLIIDEQAERVTVESRSGTTIDTAEINGRYASFNGSGTIKIANIYNKYAYFSKKPNKVNDDYSYETGNGSGGKYGDYNLNVVVRSRKNNEDLSNAKVVLSLDGKHIQTEYTNSRGEVDFNDLEYDQYKIAVSKSGYLSTSKSVGVYYDDTSTYVELQEGNDPDAEGRSFTFSVIGDVSGSVVPMDGVNVHIQGGGYDTSTLTSSSGTVTFSGIDVGNYSFTVSKTGYTTQTGTVTVTTNDSDNSKAITLVKTGAVTPPGPVVKTNVTFKVYKMVSAVETALPSATVTLKLNGTGTPITANTDINGIATVSNVDVGYSYGYTVELAGHTTYNGTAVISLNGVYNVNMSAPPVVPQNKTIIFNVKDENGGVPANINGANVTVYQPSTTTVLRNGTTDSSGNISLQLPAGVTYPYKVTHTSGLTSAYTVVEKTVAVTTDGSEHVVLRKKLTGTIRALEADGTTTLGNATVKITNTGNGSWESMITPNSGPDKGHATFNKLEDGVVYDYEVSCGGRISKTNSFTARTITTPVSVMLDVPLESALKRHILVNTPLNAPFQGAKVYLYEGAVLVPGDQPGGHKVTINTGLTTYEGLKPNTVYNYVIDTGNNYAVKTGSFTTTTVVENTETITLVDKTVSAVTITVRDSLLAPIDNADVEIIDQATGRVLEMKTSGIGTGIANFDLLEIGKAYNYKVTILGATTTGTITIAAANTITIP